MTKSISFSQRKGLRPFKKKMQIESMDADLKNSLWNTILDYYLKNQVKSLAEPHGNYLVFFSKVWSDFFKSPTDEILTQMLWRAIPILKTQFLSFKWNEVYDFIEFLASNINPIENGQTADDFVNACNLILEREFSGYRFVGRTITEITSESEIRELEKALESPLKSVNQHLEQALALMADRNNPDYRNSIKESISAVEAICRKITGKDSSTLGEALNEIRRTAKIELHPALNNAFLKLYGYTSSDNGIRHALLEESNLTFDDAKFLLVSCSAFVNYLVALAAKKGISLD